MVLKLTLAQNSGPEMATLIVPLPANYFLLTEEDVALRLVAPYLESLKTDSLVLLMEYSRVSQGNGAETAWSTAN
jgi:hypothetical protein